MINRVLASIVCLVILFSGCSSGVVPVTQEQSGLGDSHDQVGIAAEDQAVLKELKAKQKKRSRATPGVSIVQGAERLSAESYYQRIKQGITRDQEYQVGGGDILSITVYDEPDLSLDSVRITTEGMINFPFIGSISVQGLTTAEIEASLVKKLVQQGYLIDPHVSAEVKEYLSKKVVVLGSVKEPGNYHLRESERILDIISRAGGVDFAEGDNSMTMVREKTEAIQAPKIAVSINLRNLMSGKDLRYNFLLRDKDTLYIPKAEKIFIIGQVNQPGEYVIKGKQITVVEAIGMAGGFTRIAASNRVRVIREQAGREQNILVNVKRIMDEGKKQQDIPLEPNDIIVVPESYF